VKKNLLKICLLTGLAFVLCGCDSLSNNTGTTSTQGVSTHLTSNYDLESPKKNIYQAELEDSVKVKVDFYHKSDSKKDKKDVEYTRIMKDAPISSWKIGEGNSSPTQEDRIRLYTYKNGVTEDFEAKISNPDYTEVRILRKNYAGGQIVSTPKSEPADVIFLLKSKQSGGNMYNFDIFLRSDKQGKFSTVAEVLQECQSETKTVDLDKVEETIAVGSGETSQEIALKLAQKQAQYKKDNPPDGLNPIPRTAEAIKMIKDIATNKGKENLINQTFNFNNENNPIFEPFFIRSSNVVLNHASGSTESVDLNKQLLNIRSGELFENATEIKMIFLKTSVSGVDSYGSPMIRIKAAGKDYYYGPSQYRTEYVYTNPTKGKENLGVSTFEPVNKVLDGDPWCGFTPESKPAIYLYPKWPSFVKVKVDTSKGWMTASAPQYPENGWNVLAMPSGKIFSGWKSYTHLFYETMLPSPALSGDFEVISSANAYDELKNLALRLSLNEQEADDLAQYWTTHLPEAKYYKVGLLKSEKVDELEPLSISPAPDSLYRLRLVFKATDSEVTGTTRFFGHFERKGFSVVDWGGFVL